MRKRTLVSGLVLAAGLVEAMAVAPASGASVGSQFSICNPTAPVGALVSGPGATSLGRGGPREPDLGEVHSDLPASAKGRAGARFKASVPVYFHVVTDGVTGSLTSAQISA